MRFASYCTTFCVWSVIIFNLTIFCISFYWHMTYFILSGTWHVRTSVSQDFEIFFSKISMLKCWVLNQSVHISLLIQNNRKQVLVWDFFIFSRLCCIILIAFFNILVCVFNILSWDKMGLLRIIWDYLGFTVTSN